MKQQFTIALIAAFSVAEAGQFKSGAVTGFEKFTYGKFITRMKAPDKKGTVSSFFTYWNGPNFYPGGWNELDVEIVPSVSQNPFSMNTIYGDGTTKRESHDYKAGFDPKNDWHIYEIAWTPDFIAWSIDSQEVRRINKDDPSVKFTSKPQSVMMNFWTPTFESWGKGLDSRDMPWYCMYDYVETYTYNYDTKGFDFHWKDDFTTFDTNRWHKSDNTTFDANSTTFRGTQSYIDKGNLVLKMEPDIIENLHGVHRFDFPMSEPVKTEPTPASHHDVLAAQHYSHMDRNPHVIETVHEGPYGPYPFQHHIDPHDVVDSYRRVDPYTVEAQAQSPHYRDLYQEPHQEMLRYGEHTDQGYHFFQKNPYQRDQPYTQPKPEAQQQPRSKPVSTQKGKKSNTAANFATGYWDHEETPFEFATRYEQPLMKELMHGYEHHPDAHFEQGYWDLKDHEPHLHDDGHFSAEEHGEYHYVEPERTHHMGHYYSYRDDREHHPQHVDEHHNVHGIEHRPDDWVQNTHTHWKHETYLPMPEHSYEGDFWIPHPGDYHEKAYTTYHGDINFDHDVNAHGGQAMMAEIDHQFDDLFYNLNERVKHGIEHEDVHKFSLHKADAEKKAPRKDTDKKQKHESHDKKKDDLSSSSAFLQ